MKICVMMLLSECRKMKITKRKRSGKFILNYLIMMGKEAKQTTEIEIIL
jgi:hypothetical protein